MLTNGKESREFLYADDCSNALFEIMRRFSFFKKKNVELHLTTAKKTKIIEIAKIIKKILSKRNIHIKIKPLTTNDNLQKNVNNKSNKYLLKFWKPKFKVEQGIEKIIDYYQKR